MSKGANRPGEYEENILGGIRMDRVSKNVSKGLITFLLTAMITLLFPMMVSAATAMPAADGDPEAMDIIVQPEAISVPYGKTATFKVLLEYDDGTTQDVTKQATFVVDDQEIAKVTAGTVKGLSVGSTSVDVTYQDDFYTAFDVDVTPPLTGLTADPSTLNLVVDGSDMITLTAIYKDGNEEEVTSSAAWTSSNPKVATVDEDGTVTGVDVGSAIITASFGGKTAKVNVAVTPEVDSILVLPGSVGVAKGKTQAVQIKAVYADGTQADISKSVTLTSDDEDIATVKGTTIKGIEEGFDTFVTGSYGGQDFEIPVKVTAPIKTLTESSDTSVLNLFAGDTEYLGVTAFYKDGTDEDVSECATVVSSKPKVATAAVEDGAITVNALAKGSTTITMSYEGKKVSVKVIVTE